MALELKQVGFSNINEVTEYPQIKMVTWFRILAEKSKRNALSLLINFDVIYFCFVLFGFSHENIGTKFSSDAN